MPFIKTAKFKACDGLSEDLCNSKGKAIREESEKKKLQTHLKQDLKYLRDDRQANIITVLRSKRGKRAKN